MPVIPQEPSSGTLNRLRNLYPKSTQNTDAVSSLNFLNPSVSCPFILLINSVKTINIYVTYNAGTIQWRNGTV